MSDTPYTRTESDLKFENVEQRIDHKLDKILMLIDSVRGELKGDIQDVRTDIEWLKTMMSAVVITGLLAVLGVMIPIAWVIWSFAVKAPWLS